MSDPWNPEYAGIARAFSLHPTEIVERDQTAYSGKPILSFIRWLYERKMAFYELNPNYFFDSHPPRIADHEAWRNFLKDSTNE